MNIQWVKEFTHTNKKMKKWEVYFFNVYLWVLGFLMILIANLGFLFPIINKLKIVLIIALLLIAIVIALIQKKKFPQKAKKEERDTLREVVFVILIVLYYILNKMEVHPIIRLNLVTLYFLFFMVRYFIKRGKSDSDSK